MLVTTTVGEKLGGMVGDGVVGGGEVDGTGLGNADGLILLGAPETATEGDGEPTIVGVVLERAPAVGDSL